MQYFCKAQTFTTDISAWDKVNLQFELNQLALDVNGIGFGYFSDATPTFSSNQKQEIVIPITKDILFPKINVKSYAAFDFGVYRYNSGTSKYELIYSKHFASSVIGAEVGIEIHSGDYCAVASSNQRGFGFIQSLGSYQYLVNQQSLVSDFANTDLATLSNYSIFFQVFQEATINIVQQNRNLIGETNIRMDELFNQSYGFFDSATPSWTTNQRQMILVRVLANMPSPTLNVKCVAEFDFGIYRYSNDTEKYELVHTQHFNDGTVEEGVISKEIKAGDICAVACSDARGFGYKTGTTSYLRLSGVNLSLVSDFTEADILTVINYNIYFEVVQQAVTDEVKQNTVAIQSLSSEMNNMNESIEQIEDIIGSDGNYLSYLFNEPTNRIGLVRNTNFNSTTLPEGWTNNENLFVMSANGVIPPEVGGIDDRLQFPQYADFDASCVTFAINADTAPDLFLTRYGLQYPNDGANLIRFDFANKHVIVYAPAAPGVMPTTVIQQYNIPFDFVAGRYVLSVSNFAEIQKYSIFGAGVSVNFYLDTRKISTAPGRPHDTYGIIHMGGSYLIKQATFSSQLAQDPDVLVVGDSIAEADTIRTEEGGGFENRWVGLLSKKTKVALWAQGGNTSTNINNDLSFLVSTFKPKKVIYAIGTNDKNYNTWRANAIAFTTAFENIGAEVIYTTSVLRPAYETAHAKIRAWIAASGKRYIDFCAALSVDGECTTNKTGYFIYDGLHPNPAGHKLMFEAAVTSLPDLVNI